VSEAPRRVTRIAAYALCVAGDAILLSRIAPGHTAESDGMWTLPGGGIEFGEHPRDGALRELEEETGLVGEIIDLADVDSWAGVFTDPRDGILTDWHGIRILYRVRIVAGTLRNEVDGSTDLCRWVPRDELATLPLVDLAETGIGLAFDARP
jgi:ADP-ribose pyrophosphatase YjhB (NUDIX family)